VDGLPAVNARGSMSSEQSSDRGDVIGPSWVGRDVKDDVILFLGDLPLRERAAPSLGGGERLQLLAETGHRLVANFKEMTAASSAEPTPGGQCLPSLHPCGTVVRAQGARDGQLDQLRAVSTIHACMVSDACCRPNQGVRVVVHFGSGSSAAQPRGQLSAGITSAESRSSCCASSTSGLSRISSAPASATARMPAAHTSAGPARMCCDQPPRP
jgi:hypothetical protein